MKKLIVPFFSILAFSATFTLSSCSDNGGNDEITKNPDDTEDPDDGDGTGEPGSTYQLRIIGFEQEELPSEGYIVAEGYGYTEKELSFTQYYTDWGGGTSSWSGFAVSNNHDKDDASVYTNEFSVYGDGGCEGSEQFGLLYFSEYDGPAVCTFGEGKEYEMEYLYVTNSTCTYFSLLQGDGFAKAFEDGDWFMLTITGYDAAGDETGSVDFYLADYRDGKSDIVTNWTKIELNALGEVNSLGFTFTSTDNGEWGINTPAYACIDNIAYRAYGAE